MVIGRRLSKMVRVKTAKHLQGGKMMAEYAELMIAPLEKLRLKMELVRVVHLCPWMIVYHVELNPA